MNKNIKTETTIITPTRMNSQNSCHNKFVGHIITHLLSPKEKKKQHDKNKRLYAQIKGHTAVFYILLR